MIDLAEVYDEHLRSFIEERERDPLRLFVTDVGKCPRAVALRMMQAEKKPLSHIEERNKRLMFDLADYIEEKLMSALEAKGLLAGYQESVDISDRDNWGGRLDILTTEPRVVEVKTIRSNAFRFDDRPRPEHVCQAVIYQHYLGHELLPVLVYFDRGGSNTTEQYEVSHDWGHISAMMDELDAVRANLPELPDVLPRVLKSTDRNKKVRNVPDWRCERCDYAGASCSPPTAEVWWNGSTITSKADPEVLLRWAEERAGEELRKALREALT